MSKGGEVPSWHPADKDTVVAYMEQYMSNPVFLYEDLYLQSAHTHTYTYQQQYVAGINESMPWPHSTMTHQITPVKGINGTWDVLKLGDGQALLLSKVPYVRGCIDSGQIHLQWLCAGSCCWKFRKWAQGAGISHLKFTAKSVKTDISIIKRPDPVPTDWEARRKELAKELKESSPEIREEVSRLLQEAADILLVDGWTKGMAHKWNKKNEKEKSSAPIF